LHQDSLSQGGNAQNDFSDSFHSFGQAPGRSVPRTMWNTGLLPAGEEMSRYPSQDSIGAASQGTTHSSSLSNSYDQTGSVGMYPSVSQMSFHMSYARSDVTGRSPSPDNSALYTPTQVDLQAFESYPYGASEDISGSHPLFHRNSDVALTSGHSFSMYPTTEDDAFASTLASAHLPITHDGIYNPNGMMDSPTVWTNGPNFLDSQRSSPALDDWTLPPPHLTTSTSSSPLDYSPSLEGLSPRYVQCVPDMVMPPPYKTDDRTVRKPIGPRQSKVVSDLASRNRSLVETSETPDESLRFVGRSSLEVDNNARDHPYYHNVTPQADGLYHCPWEGKPSCQHKPEKLKCNYEYETFPSLYFHPQR